MFPWALYQKGFHKIFIIFTVNSDYSCKVVNIVSKHLGLHPVVLSKLLILFTEIKDTNIVKACHIGDTWPNTI